MIGFNWKEKTIDLSLSSEKVQSLLGLSERFVSKAIIVFLFLASVGAFYYFYNQGLSLAYNDARSHLDIGRRVVEGLKPGFAQLGSVWLPLTHLLMVPTVWNDFMWHTGLSGALQSMVAYIATSYLIYSILKHLNVGLFGRIIGVLVFATNLNILYLQSTAMTELLLLATMTAGIYDFILWYKYNNLLHLVKSSFWIMLSTLIRYDGWFLFLVATGIIVLQTLRKKGYKAAEGTGILFCTLAGFGIVLWLLWNQLIFKDALYFAFGPYSAHAQQQALARAGVLATKGNLPLSVQVYTHAMAYNIGSFTLILGFIGSVLFYLDKKLDTTVRIASLTLLAALAFNVIALFLGHSVLFLPEFSGNTWFNVRYGIMVLPSVAIFIGYLIHRLPSLRFAITGLMLFVLFFTYTNVDAVTIDDAKVGASQKNVSQVSNYLRDNAKNTDGFVLISVASHDAVVFSSGLPMKKFIHEGTGAYWDLATTYPDEWATWVILRTGDDSDFTWHLLKNNTAFKTRFDRVHSYPFADIYALKPEFRSKVQTQPVLGHQK